ncbi:MAG TPA: hypothetical protein VMG59_02175 [Phycisphaerae bacterium]|nr:hypothetical protein [Phycisphaerae bacterium]
MPVSKCINIPLLAFSITAALGSAPVGTPVWDYSAIDLSTHAYKVSKAFAVSGSQLGGDGSARRDGNEQALFWVGTPLHPLNLNSTESGLTWSWIRGMSTNRQVGWGKGMLTDGNMHALLWFGTVQSIVDLNPSGFESSQAYGVCGNQEIGQGRPINGGIQALLWTDTSQSAVNLNPSWSSASYCYTTDGTHQVGAAEINNNYHAVLWHGTAGSVIDLNPTGFSSSQAYGLSGNQQAGFGTPNGKPNHALVWYGSAGSVVDLNPTGFSTSYAMSTNGKQQVGFGLPPGANQEHALVWSGTAQSCVDLQQFLPPDAVGSMAICIDAQGNIAGWASYGSGSYHAVEWVPRKAPGSIPAK